MKFRCAGLSDGTCNGDGISLEIWFQGCTIGCKGCHNPQLQDIEGGFDYYTEDIIEHINKFGNFYNSVTMLGGEPLLQLEPLLILLRNIKLPIILYTGFTYEKIPDEIKKLAYKIIDGPYIEELKSSDGLLSTTNQHIYINQEILNYANTNNI